MRLHEVIWPNKYILMMFGLWPMHPNTTLAPRLFTHFRFIVLLFALMSLLVPEINTVVIYWGDIGILSDLGSLIFVHTLMVLKMLYFCLRQQSFRSVYQYLKDFWDLSDDPSERKHYEQLAKIAKQVTVTIILLSLGNLLMFEATSLFTWLKNRHEINESLHHRPLLVELCYGFDTQQTPTYELVFAWQSFCGLCIVLSVSGFDCTMMVFIVHVSAQFRLIAAQFRAIGREINQKMVAESHYDLRAKIGKLIAQHQQTIRVATELSSVLSPIIFCQIMSSGLGICLGGYAVIEGDGSTIKIVKFCVLFVTLLIQLVLWCASAEILIQESTNIVEAIYYEVPWFKLTPSLRRDLGFVMMRAQKGCHVSALYQVMSITRITEVLKAAGSYMALLRSMKK